MKILNLENVSKTYMSKKVLDEISIGIDAADKIGVVGAPDRRCGKLILQ